MNKKFTWTFVFLFYVILLIGFEWIVQKGFISRALLPSPSDLFILFSEQKEVLFTAFLQTAGLATISFLIASLLAFFMGLLLNQIDFLQKTFIPLTLFLQTVPIIAIAPLLVIYFGFSSITTITAATIVCFFPVFISTLIGLRQAKLSQKELFKFLKASRLQTLIHLEIPSALPTIQAGLRTSAGLSVIGVVSGEFLVGNGLGALIDSSRLQQRVDFVFASLILLSILGLMLMKFVEIVFNLLFKKYLVRS